MCVTLLKKFLLEIKIVIVKFKISISVQWAKQASRQTAGKEDGEEVISPDGQYLMHMAAQSWLLLGGATKLNITQKRFLLLSSAPRTIRCAAATPPPQPLVQSQLSTTTVQPNWDCAASCGRRDFHLRCEPSCTIYKPNLGLKLYYQRQGVAK